MITIENCDRRNGINKNRRGNMAEDRRIRNTKKKIRQAMLDCLSTEGLDKINVTMLCNVADINRSTFYTYYSDPKELYELLELEVILGLNRFLRKQEFDRKKAAFMEKLDSVKNNTDNTSKQNNKNTAGKNGKNSNKRR